MAMNVVAKRSDNERVPNALFELALVPSGNEVGVGTKLEFVLGTGVEKSPSIEKIVDVVPVVLATRVHSPVTSLPDTKLQYASNPSQVFEHLAIIQVASLSPSHSSKGEMLEAA
jgi:hypothetical protein